MAAAAAPPAIGASTTTPSPPWAKVTGGYVNSALAKTEAQLNGFDEAIMLTHEGHVSEGSGENIFVVAGGKLITPSASGPEVARRNCTEPSITDVSPESIRASASSHLGPTGSSTCRPLNPDTSQVSRMTNISAA